MYGRTPEAAKMRQELTLKAVQEMIGGCREWLPEKAMCCWKPAEYVLWGKQIPKEGLGPRCYDHAAIHVGRGALDPRSQYALINLSELARVIDQAHLAFPPTSAMLETNGGLDIRDTSEDEMSVLRRWECPKCGRKLFPGDTKPRRAYHHTRGKRCDGAWVEIEYVRADACQGAVEALDVLTYMVRSFMSQADYTIPAFTESELLDALTEADRHIGGNAPWSSGRSSSARSSPAPRP